MGVSRCARPDAFQLSFLCFRVLKSTNFRMRRILIVIYVVLCHINAMPVKSHADPPKLADNRLSISLFVESPNIVTPIGMVIDSRDRIFVVESHTHHPPADYAGPKGDRIRVFVDSDDDGQPDSDSVFAENLQQAMNLAVSPDGDVYVVCAREVLRLVDQDDDGKCDRRDRILKLDTQERYAHNSLLGITFGRDGWMYVARGNTGSREYSITGPDGSSVAGYGDGGSVIRCRQDGSKISEFATGFWNPFDLKFDQNGRLLLVDNDPDARGPNRLLHVVQGGDYGYKSVYGGAGNHPFQGWDGSLPGTLPFIAGTGEAPSGLLDCRRSALPREYEHSVLVTIWNENSIERFDLRSRGASVVSNGRRPFLTGGKEFRPVAMDCDSRGNLFVTDWVLVDYPNHGRGRIWRIRCSGAEQNRPQPYFADPLESDDVELLSSVQHADISQLISHLQNNDAFLNHAAVVKLSSPGLRRQRRQLLNNASAAVRLGALLAEKRVNLDSPDVIRKMLRDSNARVRLAALMWAGESLNPMLRDSLDAALRHDGIDTVLLEAYLAAAENLNGSFARDYQARKSSRANTLKRVLPKGLISRLAQNDQLPEDARALAIRRFDDVDIATHQMWLVENLMTRDDIVSLAIAQRFAYVDPGRFGQFADALATVAMDESRRSEVRSEAMFALRRFSIQDVESIVGLLQSEEVNLAIETARTVRAWLAAGRSKLQLDRVKRMDLRSEVEERLQDVEELNISPSPRPTTTEQWQQTLASGGDASRGRRVFFSENVGCSKCHTVGGRGGTLGPDLGGLVSSRSRQQVVDSIINPSAEFAPQYQAWIVNTVDGQLHTGLQLDHKAGGKIDLTLRDGGSKTFSAAEIENYFAAPASLMPSGLESTMTVEEFRDLVQFLHSPGR